MVAKHVSYGVGSLMAFDTLYLLYFKCLAMFNTNFFRFLCVQVRIQEIFGNIKQTSPIFMTDLTTFTMSHPK